MTLDELYAAVPGPVDCPPGCTDCCGGTWMLPEEWDATGLPREGAISWDGKWFCSMEIGENGPTGECLFAKDGCTVYEHRSFVCRLYATTFELECPHGRRSRPQIPRAKARELTEAWLALGDKAAYMQRYMSLVGRRSRDR
jgi:hypothetical protein